MEKTVNAGFHPRDEIFQDVQNVPSRLWLLYSFKRQNVPNTKRTCETKHLAKQFFSGNLTPTHFHATGFFYQYIARQKLTVKNDQFLAKIQKLSLPLSKKTNVSKYTHFKGRLQITSLDSLQKKRRQNGDREKCETGEKISIKSW